MAAATKTVRDALERAWRDFRRRSKYFQFKVYIAAAYIALIVATVIVVVPRGPSNKLGASVLAARGDFVIGSYIMVRNESSRDWAEVTLTLNGAYRYKAQALKAGEKVVVGLKKFQGPGAALTEADVRDLTIETPRGKETYRISFLR